MRKKTIIWLSVATLLVVLGGAIFTGTLFAIGFDFQRLSTVKLERATHEITEPFHNISVITNTADVVLVPSKGTTTRVECVEEENLRHTVSLKDGTLIVEVQDTRKWYEHIGIGLFGDASVTIYLPAVEYATLTLRTSTGDVRIQKDLSLGSIDVQTDTGDVMCNASPTSSLKVNADTGDIEIASLTTGTIDLSVDTGDIEICDVNASGAVAIDVGSGDTEIKNLTCSALVTTGDTGDLFMNGVTVGGLLSIRRDTGDVQFYGCDAAEAVIQTTTGDVEGSFVTDKTFVVKSSTGDKRVPQGTTGGRCEITTSTGDIEIEIRK